MKHHILLAGGTGTIGKDLVLVLLKAGHRLRILTRQQAPLPLAEWAQKAKVGTRQLEQETWNPQAHYLHPEAFNGITAVMNLAGEGVADKRWSPARKQAILESRTRANQTLFKAYQSYRQNSQGGRQEQAPDKSLLHPLVYIVSSAIGWYGPDPLEAVGSQPFTESDPPATDFLGQTCVEWENSSQAFEDLGCRRVILRTGIVLSKRGGALPEFLKPLAFKVAATLGNGRQIISWIHVQDLCQQFLWALENPAATGVYNAVAPAAVSNEEMTKTLAQVLGGKHYLHIKVPAFVLKAVLGEMSIEVLKSTHVSAQKIMDQGFQFCYPQLTPALQDLMGIKS